MNINDPNSGNRLSVNNDGSLNIEGIVIDKELRNSLNGMGVKLSNEVHINGAPKSFMWESASDFGAVFNFKIENIFGGDYTTQLKVTRSSKGYHSYLYQSSSNIFSDGYVIRSRRLGNFADGTGIYKEKYYFTAECSERFTENQLTMETSVDANGVTHRVFKAELVVSADGAVFNALFDDHDYLVLVENVDGGTAADGEIDAIAAFDDHATVIAGSPATAALDPYSLSFSSGDGYVQVTLDIATVTGALTYNLADSSYYDSDISVVRNVTFEDLNNFLEGYVPSSDEHIYNKYVPHIKENLNFAMDTLITDFDTDSSFVDITDTDGAGHTSVSSIEDGNREFRPIAVVRSGAPILSVIKGVKLSYRDPGSENTDSEPVKLYFLTGERVVTVDLSGTVSNYNYSASVTNGNPNVCGEIGTGAFTGAQIATYGRTVKLLTPQDHQLTGTIGEIQISQFSGSEMSFESYLASGNVVRFGETVIKPGESKQISFDVPIVLPGYAGDISSLDDFAGSSNPNDNIADFLNAINSGEPGRELGEPQSLLVFSNQPGGYLSLDFDVLMFDDISMLADIALESLR